MSDTRLNNAMKIKDIINVQENATTGATSSGNIATVVSPHLAIGKDRGKKSFTGSPGKSGTKAPVSYTHLTLPTICSV